MTVVNLNAGQGHHFRPGDVPGFLNVYCVDAPYADFAIAIVNPNGPVWHRIRRGDMRTFQVDGFPAWVFNQGPSRVQLLYVPLELEGVSVEDIEGATAWDGHEAWVKPRT